MKTSYATTLKLLAEELKDGRYMKEKGHGTPGQPNYKPTLWYWITPEGKKLKVDQKAGGGGG
jgi:hypothetical protein